MFRDKCNLVIDPIGNVERNQSLYFTTTASKNQKQKTKNKNKTKRTNKQSPFLFQNMISIFISTLTNIFFFFFFWDWELDKHCSQGRKHFVHPGFNFAKLVLFHLGKFWGELQVYNKILDPTSQNLLYSKGKFLGVHNNIFVPTVQNFFIP